MMKNVFSVLLLYILLGIVLTNKQINQKGINPLISFKKLEKKQKEFNKAGIDNVHKSSNIHGTNINPKDKTKKLVKTPKQNDNVSSNLQIKKIHNFERYNNEKKIKFNIFFYFFRRKIAKTIKLKIGIIYDDEIKNQEKKTLEESVQCTCTLEDKYKERIGLNGIGENIDYICEGSTNLNLKITKAYLDKDYSLLIDNEEINLEDKSFSQTAIQESLNMVSTQSYNKVGSLDDAQVELPLESDYFRINGVLNPKDLLSKNDVIPMQFIEYSKGKEIKKLLSCTAIQVEAPKCSLECNNMNQLINISSIDISLAESMDPNIYMKINMEHEDEKIEKVPVKYYYRSSSSKWSTGTIIGLSVGAAVLIIGSAILACVLRHPTASSQPVDDKNRTVVKLRTDEIYNVKNNN